MAEGLPSVQWKKRSEKSVVIAEGPHGGGDKVIQAVPKRKRFFFY